MNAISVVTVCRDPGNEIDRTASAVAAQDQPGLEWIVVDGASRDGTPARLRALPRPPDRMVSEPDRGIADAFNKGLALASGEWVLYLNAGDELLGADALRRLLAGRSAAAQPWLAGGGAVLTADGRELYRRLLPAAAGFDRLLARSCQLIHPATVVATAALRTAGGFDISYRSSMDYELWLRLWRSGLRPVVVPEAVAAFRLGGTSGDLLRRAREDRRARLGHGCALGGWSERRLLAAAWCKQRLGFLRRWRWAMRCKERWCSH